MDHSAQDESNLHSSHIANVTLRRKIKNRIIANLIATSGWLVLLTLGLLLWYLIIQVIPLSNDPSVKVVHTYLLPQEHEVLLLGDLRQGEPLVTRDKDCRIHFHTLNAENTLEGSRVIPTLCSDKVKLHWLGGELFLAKLSESGIVRIEKITQIKRILSSQLHMSLALTDPEQPQDYEEFDFNLSKHRVMLTVRRGDQWQVKAIERETNQLLFQQTIDAQHMVLLPQVNRIVHVNQQRLTTTHIHTAISESIELSQPVKSLQAFPGQRSLFIAYADNQLQKWSIVNRQGALQFEPLYTTDMPWPIQHVLIHTQENAAIILSEHGSLSILNHVTAQTLSETAVISPITQLHLINNSLYVLSAQGVVLIQIENMQGINTAQALWGENQYEGYAQQDYIWQTTSASDHYETKYSIVPLVMGSLKASFLALLIAVPLAISAAIYTGYFAPRRLRNWMKPSLEILEAIPSVVLGFIAAIWLAPLAEQFILAVILFVLLIPFVLMIVALIHQPLVEILPQRFKAGWELPVVALLLLLNGLFVGALTDGALIEHGAAGASLIPHDIFANINKSTLVVALALGVAIVPSIYSLAEDAIFEVPISLQQASLALGATRLQTLRQVVLVLAYPGILSAITLGLGRAFGETMIVLMVTGNTPVADWDLLSGIRTLTANLAIELPESEVSSSHYQILLLTALVLFSFTFVLNTLAEVLRQWLRNNYRHG